MTDTPSLLDRIKAAMNTYPPAADDLNARAVIDAIVGMVKWKTDQTISERSWYSVATFVGIDIGETNDAGAGLHIAIFNDAEIGNGNKADSRAAVEAAFRAALMGEGK